MTILTPVRTFIFVVGLFASRILKTFCQFSFSINFYFHRASSTLTQMTAFWVDQLIHSLAVVIIIRNVQEHYLHTLLIVCRYICTIISRAQVLQHEESLYLHVLETVIPVDTIKNGTDLTRIRIRILLRTLLLLKYETKTELKLKNLIKIKFTLLKLSFYVEF